MRDEQEATVYTSKRAQTETMLTVRYIEKKEKKSLTISHTQHITPPIPTPISTRGKEWGYEKKGVPCWKQEKTVKMLK